MIDPSRSLGDSGDECGEQNESQQFSPLPSFRSPLRLSSPGLTPPLTPRGATSSLSRISDRKPQFGVATVVDVVNKSLQCHVRVVPHPSGGEKSEQWKPTDDAEETAEKENPAAAEDEEEAVNMHSVSI